MSATLKDKIGRRDYLRNEWKKLWESKPDRNFTAEEVDQLKQWNDELSELGAEIEQLTALEEMAKGIVGTGERKIVPDTDGPAQAQASDDRPARLKSVREILAEHKGFQAFREAGGQGTFRIDFGDDTEVKALISLDTVSPQNLRLSRIEPYPVEQRMVSDLLMQGTIDRGTLEYYQETTFTNAAAETAEGDEKPEAELGWTLQTESVAKIAAWIPATSEALMDVGWLESTIRGRLALMVRRREEYQILNGDGVAPNLRGIMNRVGIQTEARNPGEPPFDPLYRAMTAIRVQSFYEPSAIVMHPNDWAAIRLTRTQDGVYILGNPGDPDAAQRLWGLQVRTTTDQPEGTALVGAFSTAAQRFIRSGITVVASTEHADYFIRNKVALLAEMRVGLAVYQPLAFCTVTGLNVNGNGNGNGNGDA